MGYVQILPLLGSDRLGRETVGKFIKEKGTLSELSLPAFGWKTNSSQ